MTAPTAWLNLRLQKKTGAEIVLRSRISSRHKILSSQPVGRIRTPRSVRLQILCRENRGDAHQCFPRQSGPRRRRGETGHRPRVGWQTRRRLATRPHDWPVDSHHRARHAVVAEQLVSDAAGIDASDRPFMCDFPDEQRVRRDVNDVLNTDSLGIHRKDSLATPSRSARNRITP